MQTKQQKHRIKMQNYYYIFPAELLKKVELNTIIENKNSVRWNNNKTKFVCKSKLSKSPSLYLKEYKAFTHAEILKELNQKEWNIPIN